MNSATPVEQEIEVKKLGIFKSKKLIKKDVFWEFMQEKSQEQVEFDNSGIAFCDLDMILDARGKMIFDFGIEESNELSKIRETSMALFDSGSATSALEFLVNTDLQRPEIESFYKSEGREDESEFGCNAVLSALETAKIWLSTVNKNEIGLLIVG